MKNQSINKLNQILLYENVRFHGVFFVFFYIYRYQTELV